MKVLIVGAGEVGYNLSLILSGHGHNVTIIEQSAVRGLKVDEEQDVRIVIGDGSSARVLEDAGVKQCDAFLALTNDDRSNILSCSLAKCMGATLTIARIHDETYSDTSLVNYQLHFGIDHLVNPEAICAVELAKEIRNPGRVAVENFARGQIEVQQLIVAARSTLLETPLKDLKLDSRVRVGYVQRGEAFEVASAETIFQEGDVVTLFGHPEVLFELRSKFDPSTNIKKLSVVLFGGSETAIALIRMLNNRRFNIRLIDIDAKCCKRLAERFPAVNIIHGDGTSLRLLEEEQIGEADYFVACTKHDEHNIMTCLQASKLGAKHVQLVINKADYEEMLDAMRDTLNIETVVSPRRASAAHMERLVMAEAVSELAKLPDGGIRIIEVRVNERSACANQTVRSLHLPKGAILAALLHKYDVKVPAADDTILAGDRLVVIVQQSQEKALLKTLLG
jgi:trk system potassium uptake protein TrkA